jgi:hypothetical protein
VRQRDPQQCYKAFSTLQLYNFFDYPCNQKVGKDGWKKRRIKKKSPVGTYWKVFRLVFERVMEEKMYPKLNCSMHRVGIPPSPKLWKRLLICTGPQSPGEQA